MTNLIQFTPRDPETDGSAGDENTNPRPRPVGIPSNQVYARVGDAVLHAAQDGVRRGLQPQDIIREIKAAHSVQLNLGELRLLLASRRLPQ
ncbi:MAG TPA: hypothetical protein VKX16_03255 [Chloroflexota bacterium]|nr:hypothetical protein [Chloroflexota bacterium]